MYIIDVCVDTDSIYRIDVNGNGCDWYNEEDNALECGNHDGYYTRVYFDAYEDCCVCKYPSGIKRKHFKKMFEIENLCN